MNSKEDNHSSTTSCRITPLYFIKDSEKRTLITRRVRGTLHVVIIKSIIQKDKLENINARDSKCSKSVKNIDKESIQDTCMR